MTPTQQTDGMFAVVQIDDAQRDFVAIARALSEPLELTLADLITLLPQRAGIIAENLTEHVANWCVGLLLQAGVRARSVPQSKVVEPPEVVTAKSGRPDEEVFFYTAADRRGVVKWTDVIWIDFVSVQEPATEEFNDWDVFPKGEGTTVRRIKRERLVIRRSLSIDLLVYEPWMILRIPQEGFDFATAGLPVLPNRKQNLVALAESIAMRATAARVGPGLDWVESQTLPEEHREPSQTAYRNFLRWQLTRLFLD